MTGEGSTGRVDLEKMRRAYEESRERTKEMPLLTQRAVARIDSNLHMTGRIGRFHDHIAAEVGHVAAIIAFGEEFLKRFGTMMGVNDE